MTAALRLAQGGAARPGRFALVAALVVLLVSALGVPLSAHPTSLTTISIALRHSGLAEVVLTSPADALIIKLTVARETADPETQPAHAPTIAPHLSLEDLASGLPALIQFRADADAIPLAVDQVRVDPAGVATVRLTGAVPAGATTVTWRSQFVFGAYPVAIETGDGKKSVQWVQGPDRTQPVAIHAPSRVPVIAQAVALGFLHIVPRGLDHILFVAGLALAGTGRRRLALLVTAFTLAHSLTLGLSLYGVFSLPSRAVEPLIALSVAYVGLERALNASLERARLAVVFGFGLLHGLGFADALAGLHLPRPELATVLVSFNLGVEAGQLTVLASVLAALWLLARSARLRAWPVTRLAAASVGLTGVIWTMERVL